MKPIQGVCVTVILETPRSLVYVLGSGNGVSRFPNTLMKVAFRWYMENLDSFGENIEPKIVGAWCFQAILIEREVGKNDWKTGDMGAII